MFNYDDKSWRIYGAPESYFTDKTTIEIPSKYLKIIQKTIDFLEDGGKPPITNTDNSNLKKLKYFINKEKPEQDSLYLIPLAIYKNKIGKYNYEFYLTKEDIKILLSYKFVVDAETLMHVLNKLEVKTKNNYRINLNCIYKWKILNTQDWKDRYKKLLTEYWNWNNNNLKAREIKDEIIKELDSPKYYLVFEGIKKLIEANHLENS
ncbi:hypothetical protein C7H19_24995 [Aphanothece hegewaldii CCALA 016]|uniref:Uncharacterized protein n=1 Tax=Aphanothece hegewaldii CCALA 016 TaxID=2107694 RepID=A0A2T1LQE0_9CHRO|nr:hypothetical protein [Aphanothece hegewaldii]PSF27378.1 hypothetical protein C7H19_24995 [Aphanothece hegewaldii CCALA 016]